MPRRVGQHHGDLRSALIEAALALVARGGVAELSLRAVAREAGVSAGAPYHHFPDKTALLAAVAREGFTALAVVQRSPDILTLVTPAERLEAMVAAYVRFSMAHRTHYAVMFRASPSEVAGEGGEALKETAMGTFQTLVEAIVDANPALSEAEGLRRALLGWSMAHGAVQVSQWAATLDPGFDADALAADVGREVLRMAQGS